MKNCIIIPTHNRAKYLESILSLLLQQTEKIDLIIVVNDGSTDNTSQLLKTKFTDVIELEGDGNLWWTGTVNLGIKYVLENHPEIDNIILQNDDVIIREDWIEQLVNIHKEHPYALIGCAAVNMDSPDIVSYAGKSVQPWFAIKNNFQSGLNINEINREEILESFDLIGRGILIPINVFKKIGLYDSKHFKHRGDTEFPLRARKAGYKLYVSFKPLVYVDSLCTSAIDIKHYYKIKDFIPFFFDFRSSAYIKYRFYYSKIAANNIFQFCILFTFSMLGALKMFLKKLNYNFKEG